MNSKIVIFKKTCFISEIELNLECIQITIPDDHQPSSRRTNTPQPRKRLSNPGGSNTTTQGGMNTTNNGGTSSNTASGESTKNSVGTHTLSSGTNTTKNPSGSTTNSGGSAPKPDGITKPTGAQTIGPDSRERQDTRRSQPATTSAQLHRESGPEDCNDDINNTETGEKSSIDTKL